MKKITPQVKAIADRHIAARMSGSFTDPPVTSADQLREKLFYGETFSTLMEEIEMRYCTVTSVMIARQLKHASKDYTRQVYNAFKRMYSNQS